MNTGIARESMVSIAELLAPDRPDVVREVRTDPDGNTWRALIRALSERGLVAVFDWEDDPGEIRSLLEALPSFPDDLSWSWYGAYESEVDDLDQAEAVERLLEVVGEGCARIGRVLLSLETGSDSYAVIFMSADDYARVPALGLVGLESVRLGQWSGIEMPSES
ncbi:hypothetical protein SAMN04244553_4559 [Nocardia amikacinitolerans]|uniref:DUF6630 domain-containing protein n=1 Tax=Nocardia amikacinitolerans TaxID=756689 RepID=A0A285LW92_9NOCA|nr:hypothetical protein [Nocardia amikacinitolerans]SNY87611.1 hypothetical protein SAMN04244553_4559 [Nocardia amikacinitolerans]